MVFTYTEDLTVERDYVRFHTGDTIEARSFLSDAIITSLLATAESADHAVADALRYLLKMFSRPKIRADWSEVDWANARAGYQKALDDWLDDHDLATVYSIGADVVDTARSDLLNGDGTENV